MKRSEACHFFIQHILFFLAKPCTFVTHSATRLIELWLYMQMLCATGVSTSLSRVSFVSSF